MINDAYGNLADFKFGFPFHWYGGLTCFFNGEQARFQNGLKLGVCGNNALGVGGQLGWTGELAFGNFALGFGVCLQYYGNSERYLCDYFAPLYGVTLSELNGLQYGMGVNLIYYCL